MTRTTFWDGDVFSNLSNTQLYFCSASSLTQQSTGRHDAPPRHNPENLSNTQLYFYSASSLTQQSTGRHDAPPRQNPDSESYNLCSYSRSNNICTCTNFKVYGLTWLGVEPTACHARDGCYFEKDKVLLRHTYNILSNQSTRNPTDKKTRKFFPLIYLWLPT